MQKHITASQLIKRVLNSMPGTNPLQDDFDQSLFSAEILEEIKYLETESIGVQDIDQIDKIVEFFKQLNVIYETILDYILEYLPFVHNNDQALFELVLRVSNYDFCNVASGEIDYEPEEDNHTFQLTAKRKLKNHWGETMYSADAIDTTADVANLLFLIIKKYHREANKSAIKLDKETEGTLFRKITAHANLLFVLRENINLFVNEFVELKIDSNNVALEFEPKQYLFLKATGKKRYQNHIHEPVIYFPGLLKEQSPRYNLTLPAGELKLVKTNEKYENPLPAMVTSSILVYYFHLNTTRLQHINTTVHGIATVIAQLQSLLMLIDAKQVVRDAELTDDLKNSPVRIRKNSLVSYLQDTTELSRTSIERILHQLVSVYTAELDIWKTPLVSSGDYYYFLLPPLAGGHPVYLVQQVLNAVMPRKDQLYHFKNLVIQELQDTKHGYTFNRINDTELKQATTKNIDNVLVYDLSNLLLFIQVFHIDFPIQSAEYGNAIVEAAESANTLSELVIDIFANNPAFAGKKQSDSFKVILCNFPSISGMNIEDCFVMDLTLIKNYFDVGEYRRAAVLLKDGHPKQSVETSYKYYNTEEEFNDNFKRFCYSPDPIIEMNETLKRQQLPIAKGFFDFNLSVEYAEDISNKDIAYHSIQKIEYYLRQLVYFAKALDKEENAHIKEHVESRLTFLLPEIFNRIALEKSDRYLRVELIQVFETAGLTGISYLMFINLKLFEIISKKNVSQSKKFEKACDSEQAKKDFDLLLKAIVAQNIFGLSGFNLTLDLPDERIDNLVEFFINDIGSIPQRHYTLEEMDERWRIVIIFAHLVKGHSKFDVYLYKFLLNFIDLLNYNFLYQKARDVSEEILAYSFKNEKEPMIGWLCLLKCYIKQNNSYEALAYANLALCVLQTKEEVEDYLFTEAFYSLMLLYRSIGYIDQLKNVFELLKTKELSEYDLQKIHLSYYFGLLKGDQVIFDTFLPEIKAYLLENIDKIKRYGHFSCLPWFTLVLNIINLVGEKIIEPDAFWPEMLSSLEAEIEPDTAAKVKAQFQFDENVTIDLYKDALSRLFDTRNHFDLTYDIKQLMLLANKVTERAIVESNFDLIFLSGLILTDQMLTFQMAEAKEKDHFLARGNEQYKERINSYTKFIRENLKLKEGQVLVWLFSIHTDVYVIFVRNGASFELQKIESWDIEKMHSWVASMKDFYFPDKAEYTINEQEQDYITILRTLKEFSVPIDGTYDEILFYSSIRMGEFPFQLISGKANDNIETHEWIVKEYCQKEQADFLSFNKPVSNVISLEWVIEHGADILLSALQFTTELWTPVEDGDLVLNMTYERLLPFLSGTYSTTIHTKPIPDKKISSTINIFLAHGGKDFEGFRAVYTKDSEGHAIIKEKGVPTIFGTGTIAILFICNSAFISKQLFAEKLVAFTQEILSLGYAAVIAPAWGLNPEIAPAWLERFLACLKQGMTVSIAVHKTNHAIAKEGYREYIGFYSPTGWAGMHLYGNPNIRFEITGI